MHNPTSTDGSGADFYLPTLTHSIGTQTSIQESFRVYIDIARRVMGSPIYSEFMRVATGNAEIEDIASAADPSQPVGILFASVVHYLAFSYPHEPLSAYLPSVVDRPRPIDAALPDALLLFSRMHAAEIRALMQTSTLQWTTVDRAASVLTAVSHVEAVAGGPVDIIELGCSAGLLLNFDRYAYDFGNGRVLGDPGSPILLSCELRPSGLRKFERMPVVGDRAGIDLNPVDARDPDACNWLCALSIPDSRDEQRRLRAALKLRAEVPLRLIKNDALVALGTEASRMRNTLCVLHSWCLYQWPREALAVLERQFCDISLSRVIHRISIEKDPRDASGAEIVHMMYEGGALRSSRLIARCDGLGRWVEWLAV
jgi:hypothetical protein